jgi:hypothetical protein
VTIRIDIDLEDFLDNLFLGRGSHKDIDDGCCLMEAVSFVAGEPWSDHPKCASPVIGAFMRRWQDDLGDDPRQTLKPYVPRLVGSKGSDEIEQQRGWMCATWLIRHHLPTWLRAAGLEEQAAAVETLPDLTDWTQVRTEWRPTLVEIRKGCNERRDRAIERIRQAAWAAEAAGAAGAAEAAGAAWAAEAAWAAGKTRQEIYDEVYRRVLAATKEKLAPTAEGLKASAVELLESMLALTESPAA